MGGPLDPSRWTFQSVLSQYAAQVARTPDKSGWSRIKVLLRGTEETLLEEEIPYRLSGAGMYQMGIGPRGPRHWSPHVPVTEYEHLVLTLLSVSPDYSSILMALQSGWCLLATGGSGGIIMSGQQTPAEKGGALCTED